MLNRTTPKRLTFIVLALLLGILLGLALFPSTDISGAELSGICDTVTEIPATECQAVETLYESTNGPAWTNRTGWLQTNTPCGWFGVTCSGGHVWQIDLTANQLRGPLPPDIGSLTKLQVLLLSNNELTGPIPTQLGQLSNLTRLNLSTNQLSGAIPAQLGALTQLREFSLAFNDLSGEIPVEIGTMASLQTVEFVSNTLEGPIPSELGALVQLEWLDLADNTLTGTIPIELGQPADLGALYIDGNKLEGEVPSQLCGNVILASLGYNMLDPVHTDSCISALIADAWQQTQTLPPTAVVAQSLTLGEVELNWTIVTQMVDTGYYEILYSETSGGPYSVHGQTADKYTNEYVISDLDPDTELFFAVRTITPANDNNQSDLVSVNSPDAPVKPTAVTLTDFSAGQRFSYAGILLAVGLLILAAATTISLRKRL